MSTAILHAGSFIHDFNDIVMKVSEAMRLCPIHSGEVETRGEKSMETRI